ncbi:MAG: hypothetical protein HC867_00700 [Bacteroidia bacterium]|nr:hypothetical protein [Bacteroidia bacterium]
MVLTASGYEIQSGNEKQTLEHGSLQNSILALYHKEPVSIRRVYSDNHQQFLEIVKSGEHSYKLVFPDGKFNEYHYRNGICAAIDIHHPLYKATVLLRR